MKALPLATLLLLAAPLWAQEPVIVNLPAEGAERSPLPSLLRVEVNGKSVLLLVDTGAAYTHLDARFLDLKRSHRRFSLITGAGDAELRTLQPVTLKIQQWAFQVETLDVDHSPLRKQCGCDVAGVLGLNVLSTFDSFAFNFKTQMLTLVRNVNIESRP